MNEIDWLDRVVAKMRALGVASLKTAEYEVVLGDAVKIVSDSKETKKTPEELLREQKERVNRTMFAASNLRPRI